MKGKFERMSMSRPARLAAFLSLLAALGAPSLPKSARAETALQGAPWPIRLRQQMDRVTQVEWRLRNAAGDLCPAGSTAFGLTFDNLDAYRKEDRPIVSQLVNLTRLPQIAAVANGSPSAAAGLQPGDTVTFIDYRSTEDMLAETKAPDLFSEELSEQLAQRLPQDVLHLTVRRGNTDLSFELKGRVLCAAPVVLSVQQKIDAYSDGRRIAVTSGLVDFTENEAELALVIGHEMGHVIHADGDAKGLSDRRKKEDDADLLGAALARCANYDIPTSLEFWKRYRKRLWTRLLRSPTHRGASGRIERIAALGPTACPLSLAAPPPGF